MAGKSTLMRQTALCVILAQMGAFVPARGARIGVVDRVLTRVGASDNLSRGESTFMVEMKETANVLRRATRRSLVVLDEIGRGTSTYDGLAIAWAVAEHLHDVIACRAMFATHYHELTELGATRSGTCENWSVSAREHAGDVVFLHKLQRGPASRSYGVACARLAGLPEGVLARARAVLAELERGASLPSGAPASLRARSLEGRPQLDLFEGAPPVESDSSHPALETLRGVDVDRLTPSTPAADREPQKDDDRVVRPRSARAVMPYAAVAFAACSWGTWAVWLRLAESAGAMPAAVEATIVMAVITAVSGVSMTGDARAGPRRREPEPGSHGWA
jgi:DNA mismatch repair protein MutS